MKLGALVSCSAEVGSTRSRNKKSAHLAALLDAAPADLIGTVVAWLSGELRQGRSGLGYSTVFKALNSTAPAGSSSLTVSELDTALTQIAALSGKGSNTERAARLSGLLQACTHDEQRFLAGLITGELRQGALAGVMAEAIAQATGTSADAVRRAAMLSGDLPLAAVVARTQGDAGLDAFRVELFRPLQPMLAQTAESVEGALETLGGVASLE